MRKAFRAQPNSVIATIVVVDFFVNGATGLIAPFFAIFVTDTIVGGSATVVGIAAATYWVVKSILQLPIARWLDRTDGERDEFWAFFVGYLLLGFVPLIYFFSTEPLHIYIAQGVYGLAMAWAVPAWYAIFTRHIDRGQISFDWTLWSTVSLGLAATIAAVAGGYLIDRLGFPVVFPIASAIILASALGIIRIRRNMFPVRPERGRRRLIRREHVH